MKKILAMLVILSMLVSMAVVVPQAADIPGDWTTYRAASEYPENSDKPQKPEAGYKYTEEGFTVIPADYTDSTPFMTVQSKEPQLVQEGIYMEFRVDDYAYNGPDHNTDSWICISITNKPKVVPGSTAYGGGWLCLIRGNGGGADAAVESWNTVEDNESSKGNFQKLGAASVTPELDNNGCEHYTFEATYNGSAYNFKVNGVSMPGMAVATANLKKLDPNGEFYVGVTLYSSLKDGTAAMTILDYGTDKAHANPPTGSDSKEPEPNLIKVADISDPSTVPENQPALYWDASVVNTSGGTNIALAPLGDNSYRATMSEALGFFSWNMTRSISYSGTDFPVFTALLRNYYGEGGTLWYYGGEILGATDSNHEDWSAYDGLYYEHEENEYVLVTVDLTDLWEGRIHGIRIDFAAPADAMEFDICYMGFFRSVDEAETYAKTRLAEKGVDVGEEESETTATEETDATDETTAPEDDTSATDETTATVETSVADETSAPQDTSVPEDTVMVDETAAPEETDVTDETVAESATKPQDTVAATDSDVTAAEEKTENDTVDSDDATGCASLVGTTAVSALLLAVAACAVMRKRED